MVRVCLMAVIMGCVLGGACSSPIKTSGPRSALSPAEVRIYNNKPAKFEHIGTITLDMDTWFKWDAYGNANAGFEQFKKQAAAMGGNGVMLMSMPGQSNGRFSAGYQGEFYFIPMQVKPPTAVAQAIYVIRD